MGSTNQEQIKVQLGNNGPKGAQGSVNKLEIDPMAQFEIRPLAIKQLGKGKHQKQRKRREQVYENTDREVGVVTA